MTTHRSLGRRPGPICILLAALATLLTTDRAAQAGFEVGNLGASNTFNTKSGFNLVGPAFFTGQGYGIAVEFTVSPTAAVSFDSAELGLAYRSGTNALSVSLMANTGGIPSGTALETMSLANIAATPSIVTVNSTVHSVLTAGASYWLVANYGAADTNIAWMANSSGQSGHTAYRTDSIAGPGSWTADSTDADPSFAVFGSYVGTVDAPPSGVLVGLGFLGMIGGRAVRRRAGTIAAGA